MDFSEAGPDTWLEAFGAAYGRMCVLAARAHHAGVGQHRIRQAMAGGRFDMQHHLDAIRSQRRHIVTLEKQATACGIVGAVKDQRRQEIREAIGQEWNAPIPDLGQQT